MKVRAGPGGCVSDHMSRRVTASRLISFSKPSDPHPASFLLGNLAAGTIPAQIGKLTNLQSLQVNGYWDLNGQVIMKLSGKWQFERIYHMPRHVIGVIGENRLLFCRICFSASDDHQLRLVLPLLSRNDSAGYREAREADGLRVQLHEN